MMNFAHIKQEHKIKVWLLLPLSLFIFMPLTSSAQSAFEFIYNNRNFSAVNDNLYPEDIDPPPTAPPAGKRPFYISHYGRHGSRYLTNRKGYELPYQMLCKADSAKQLTRIGRDARTELGQILADAEGRWGDLTEYGKQQQEAIAERMMRNFPEAFEGYAFIDGHSTNVPRCILSMGAAVMRMKMENPKLNVTLTSSHRDSWYLNHQDRHLRDSAMSYAAQRAYDAFSAPRSKNARLMEWLFVDTAYAKREMNEEDLNYYLLKAALVQQNTHMRDSCGVLINLFTYEDIHKFWQKENAWWYINYGPSPLNGGHQPYNQRFLLRQIIQEADSVIQQDVRGATLRFGHESVVLPLVCLLGLNGYNYQTLDLETLESSGWWACLVFPMASNLQFVFYRSNPEDEDVVFKVLLNEKEALLPLSSDIAPYYHWRDFRSHYLQMLDNYELSLGTEGKGVHSHLPHHGKKSVGTGW